MNQRMLRVAVTLIFICGSYRFMSPQEIARSEDSTGLVSYRLEKHAITQGEPVLVNVSLRNTSPQPLNVDFGGNGNENIRISIIKPDGQRVQRLPVGRREGITFSGQVHLEPKQSYAETLVLNEWFEFDKIGSYLIEMGLMSSRTPATTLRLDVQEGDRVKLATVCTELLSRIQTNASAQDSLAATQALSYIRDPVAVPSWKALLNRPDFNMTAISNLAAIGDATAADALLSKLNVGDQGTRSSIRSALKTIARNSPDNGIRQRIDDALKQEN